MNSKPINTSNEVVIKVIIRVIASNYQIHTLNLDTVKHFTYIISQSSIKELRLNQVNPSSAENHILVRSVIRIQTKIQLRYHILNPNTELPLSQYFSHPYP